MPSIIACLNMCVGDANNTDYIFSQANVFSLENMIFPTSNEKFIQNVMFSCWFDNFEIDFIH